MVKKLRFSPSVTKFERKNIKPADVEGTKKVSFNFRRLEEKLEKFNYSCRDSKYFCTLMKRLKDISTMDKIDMTVRNKRALRCHAIDFKSETVTENTFGVLGEDVEDDAWQFQLSSNKHGRVHGYFVENVFYVVWLDPEHQLYA